MIRICENVVGIRLFWLPPRAHPHTIGPLTHSAAGIHRFAPSPPCRSSPTAAHPRFPSDEQS
jgi:hypothetical protein